MSEKRAKLQRKKEKMDKQQQSFSFDQLSNYIALHNILTGEKPEEIVVTKLFHDWFIQEAQRHAETLGLNLGFADGPQFMGVRIVTNEPAVETAKK